MFFPFHGIFMRRLEFNVMLGPEEVHFGLNDLHWENIWQLCLLFLCSIPSYIANSSWPCKVCGRQGSLISRAVLAATNVAVAAEKTATAGIDNEWVTRFNSNAMLFLWNLHFLPDFRLVFKTWFYVITLLDVIFIRNVKYAILQKLCCQARLLLRIFSKKHILIILTISIANWSLCRSWKVSL